MFNYIFKAMNEELIAKLTDAFDPISLEADSPFYVDLRAVRADADVFRDLGRKITRSPIIKHTCQLYAGHRGGGKSTELFRLKKYLEEKNCYVVYFAADEDDIDPEDVQYTDILIACTRYLLRELNANSAPISNWIKNCGQSVKDLALTEIKFEDNKIQTGDLLKFFAQLSTTIRAVPSERKKIRDQVNPHTVTLLNALNEFIENARKQLPNNQKLVMIVDNLDRIVPINRDNKRTNHDEIFLDRANQLKGLNCHLIYTIPISMVYSSRCNDLSDIYDNDPMVLPMIMIRNPDNSVNEKGLEKIKTIIHKRVKKESSFRNLVTHVFETEEILNSLCLMSGGHVRNLMSLMGTAFDHIDDLPITQKAAKRAITQARDVLRRTVNKEEWSILAKVYQTKQIENDEVHRQLLFNRCLLQYGYYNPEEELTPWYDVHPLIFEIEQFQQALEGMGNGECLG